MIQFFYLITFTFFLLHETLKKPINKFLLVSVILHVKNNFNNLNRLIPLLKYQEYKTYELVLIIDESNKETLKETKKLLESRVIYFFTFWELFLVLFQFVIFISNSTSKLAN